jgi:hypothetical protein
VVVAFFTQRFDAGKDAAKKSTMNNYPHSQDGKVGSILACKFEGRQFKSWSGKLQIFQLFRFLVYELCFNLRKV